MSVAIKDRLRTVPVVGTAVAVQERYAADDADQYAAAIGFFGFLSLFPLIALALSVAGFLVANRPDLQQELATTIQQAIPGFSAVLTADGQATGVRSVLDNIVDNRGGIGLIGLGTLLLTGLKVVGAAGAATNAVFHLRVETSFARKVGGQLAALAVLGGLALAGTVASSTAGASVGLDTSGPVRLALSAGGTLGTLTLDFLLFLVAYRLLASGPGPAWRRLWPGALLAAAGWSALKVLGATYVAGQMDRFAFAGGIAGSLGLLALLYLAGRLYVYGAELSALLYAPGADVDARSEEISYAGEDPEVLAGGAPGAGPDGTSGPAGRDPGRARRRRDRPDLQRALGTALGIGALVVAFRWLSDDGGGR